jgi:hypothetical protein
LLRRIVIVTSLKTVSFVVIDLGMPHSTQLLSCVYILNVLVVGCWNCLLFVKRLGSEYQTGDGGHFFWVLCSGMLLCA